MKSRTDRNLGSKCRLLPWLIVLLLSLSVFTFYVRNQSTFIKRSVTNYTIVSTKNVQITSNTNDPNEIVSRRKFKQDAWYTDMLRDVSKVCKHTSHFFHHFLPHKVCNNKIRIGRCGDGSKLVCMDKFDERNTIRAKSEGKKCIVYSFGSSDDSCFESDMANKTDCEIHIFDPTSSELQNSRWTYHKYGLTGSDPTYTTFWNWRTQAQANCTGCPMKNLRDIMNELGHDWIDVLKVDIDGAEWRSFEYVYDVMGSIPATQLQIELTGLDITDQTNSLAKQTQGVYKLWENLFNDGFTIFNIEANKGTCVRRKQDRAASFEYALMRETPL